MRSNADARPIDRVSSLQASILARIGLNFGWLAGSMAFSAVTSLVYVALTARTLGPRGFGIFALVMTYGELITNLAQFQSWKAVVGFGAAHQHDRARLGRLLGFAVSLDWLSSIIGAFAGVAGVLLIAPLLHWAAVEEYAAVWFGTALLFTSSTAPAGVLRLFNRFDLQVYSETTAQIARFFGCLAGWVIGAGVNWFLCVWAMAALLQLVVQWTAVLSLGHRVSLRFGALKLTMRENRGLWPFMLRTSVSGSLSLFWMQFGTLAAGVWAGPVEAGGFRLAHRFSQAMMKPVEIGTKALFPEFAQLVTDNNQATLRKILVRVTWISAGFASLIVAAAALGGREILRLTVGPSFEFASGFLLLLCVAAAINVMGFALEPFQNAHFRAGTVLRAYMLAALFYGAVLIALLPIYGALAAALASIGAALAINIQLGVSTARILASNGRGSGQVQRSLELVENNQALGS